MERRTDTLSRIDEILRPVEDLQNRIRNRIFNGHLESRVAVGNVTAFTETPRDRLHPLGEIFGEVQPQQELSLASSLSSDGSSITPRDSRTPEELRTIPLIKTPSPPPPFAPCPRSSSRPHRSQIPVRLKNYRETDKEVAGGVRLVTAQHVVRALEQTRRNIVDLPQTLAACWWLLLSRAPAPPGAPAPAPPRVPAPRAGRGAGARAGVVALTPARAPPPPGAPVPAPPRVPAPRAGRGAGARARVVTLTPARTAASPAPASPAPAPEQTEPQRVVRYPPEVDKKLGEELQPVSNPSETLRLSLSLLSQDDCEKKIEGLRYIRTLAQHHQEELALNLRIVCFGVTQEIKNNRSCVSCAALDTVIYLCVHLRERMDKEAEWTCESLLQVFARANVFIQQHAKEALTALVHSCSPRRFLKTLVTMGLKHKSVCVRAGAALGLLEINKFMEAEKVLSAGQIFTKCFLLAVSELCQDASTEVRAHGKAILKDLVKERNFRKMWKESVSDKSRCEVERRLRDVFQK